MLLPVILPGLVICAFLAWVSCVWMRTVNENMATQRYLKTSAIMARTEPVSQNMGQLIPFPRQHSDLA
jgi:hypothetical protein